MTNVLFHTLLLLLQNKIGIYCTWKLTARELVNTELPNLALQLILHIYFPCEV